MRNPRLWLGGGIAGVVGCCAYFVAVAVQWPETQLGTTGLLLVISLFPILGIIYSYALHDFIAAESDGAANRLSAIFAIAGFTILMAMIVVQLAVGAAVPDITRALDEATARALRRGLRIVDLGLDVGWDLLIGTALIFWGFAIRRRSGLGLGWGAPSAVFGVALIGLNAATFPTPPANHGLFDIGPFIAVYMLGLSVRLALLGRQAARADQMAG